MGDASESKKWLTKTVTFLFIIILLILADIKFQIAALIGFTIFFNTLAIFN